MEIWTCYKYSQCLNSDERYAANLVDIEKARAAVTNSYFDSGCSSIAGSIVERASILCNFLVDVWLLKKLV